MDIETIKNRFNQLIRFLNARDFECDSCQREFAWGTAYSVARSNEEFEKHPTYCEYCVEIAEQEIKRARESKKPQVSPKPDKRTLNKTGRTHQLGTRVRKEFLTKLKKLARRERLKYVEVLERALDYYAKKNN